MPLYPHAIDLIRANFAEIAKGNNKPPGVFIGKLSEIQLREINLVRASYPVPLPAIVDEVLFYGKHIYKRRVVDDGYTVEDVIDQIVSAMDQVAVYISQPKMTAIQNRKGRADRYGNNVKDLAVLECTTRHPHPELFSVMPKGDFNKPKKTLPK